MARIVVLHGLGGTAATMQPLADALRADGHEVVAPTLPGHGATPEALLSATWADWLRAADVGAELAVGQSMGAGLALALASAGKVAAVVAINPLAADPDALDALTWMDDRGKHWVDVPPSTVGELAYERLPISALKAMHEALATIELSAVRCPALIVTSARDEVIDPANSDLVASSLPRSPARLTLGRSGHVATLDADRAALADAVRVFALEWLRPSASGSRGSRPTSDR
jgi:carboxylesterase